MRRICRKIKFILIKIYVDIYAYIRTINSKKVIALISCKEWKNKVTEDIMLKYYFAKIGIKSKIIDFEHETEYKKYCCAIVRSIWGFSPKNFIYWIEMADKSKIKLFNNADLIKKFLSKKNQFDVLDKYNIKHVPTICLMNDKNISTNLKKILVTNNKIVVKPHISESGNDTYSIPHDPNIKNSIDLYEFEQKKINTDFFLVQPYLKQINDGEISVVVIDGKISHAVIRFPGIFSSQKKVKQLNPYEIDESLIKTVNNILKIKEYNSTLYMRLDFIKLNSEYIVLEVELVDPILFLNNIENYIDRKSAYYKFVNSVKNKI